MSFEEMIMNIRNENEIKNKISTEEINKRIGTRIKYARRDKGLSQKELGDKLGLSADRLQKYENGVRKPKLDMLNKIAEALDIQLLSLVDPIIETEEGAMQALFALESEFGAIPKRGKTGKFYVMFDNGNDGLLNSYIEKWIDRRNEYEQTLMKASNDDEIKLANAQYRDWKRSFPVKLSADRKEIDKEFGDQID